MEEGIRFNAFVDSSGGPNACWLWVGALNDAGYGRFRRTRRGHVRAHRLAFEMAFGAKPPGPLDHICHSMDKTCPGGLCVHRRCVNPRHLRVTTIADNTLVGRSPNVMNRLADHCCVGHPRTPKNVYIEPGTGRRKCRPCAAAAARRRYHAKQLKANTHSEI